jgi:hypothetical protein
MTLAVNYDREIQIYKFTMHLNGIASLLSSTLAIYMILYKSPQQMGSYKWYLLNIVVCFLKSFGEIGKMGKF